MKIINKYDAKIIDEICKASGADSVKNATTYLRVPAFRCDKNFKCEIIDDVAFFAGVVCKKHFRLYETAVKSEFQKRGYGTLIINRIKKICKENNLSKITFRTSMSENAVDFYRHYGAIITGIKNNDYEMEMRV